MRDIGISIIGLTIISAMFIGALWAIRFAIDLWKDEEYFMAAAIILALLFFVGCILCGPETGA